MKYLRNLAALVLYIISFGLFAVFCDKLNMISYLLFMIVPMICSAVLSGLLLKESTEKSGNHISKSAILHTVYYAIYFFVNVLYIHANNAFSKIYENSKYLFAEGFSIGSEFSANLIDALLPCALCFILHIICMKIILKCKRGHNEVL